MTIAFYLICFVAGILGILAHIVFIKLPALQTAAKVGNVAFIPSDYFKNDWLALLGSLLSLCIGIFLIDNLLAYKPAVQPYLKYFFVFYGFTGQSILQAIFNKTASIINNIVDQKTNELDAIKANK